MAITIQKIREADQEAQGLHPVLLMSVHQFVMDEANVLSERAEALRIICKYMPRKQGDMTDRQFVDSFINKVPF